MLPPSQVAAGGIRRDSFAKSSPNNNNNNNSNNKKLGSSNNSNINNSSHNIVLVGHHSSSSSSSSVSSTTLATFEDVLRRCVLRQKRAFLLYETTFSLLLSLFLLASFTCLFNIAIRKSGFEEAFVAKFLPDALQCAISTSSSSSSYASSFDDQQQQHQRKLWNEPLNFFCLLSHLRLPILQPGFVFIGSLVAIFLVFIIVRGIFALRHPTKYVSGLNATLKREYNWHFDATVGKLFNLPRSEMKKEKEKKA